MSNATKKGVRQGCFGGATKQARRRNQERIANLRSHAYSYARDNIRRQMEQSLKLRTAMEDPKRRAAAIDRVAAKRMKELRREERSSV